MSKTPVCVVEAACWSNAVALRLNADVFRLVLSLLMLAAVAVAAGASTDTAHNPTVFERVCGCFGNCRVDERMVHRTGNVYTRRI